MRALRRILDRADTAPVPTISSVSPSHAAPGATVTVTGTGFLSPGGQFPVAFVSFNGVRATGLSVASATRLTCVVPSGIADTVSVYVTSPGGTAVASAAFSVTAVDLETLEATLLPVATATGLPVVRGFSVSTRVQPRGRPGTWRVEYGTTTAYGSATSERELPPKLGAHFDARWGEAGGTAGFLGGIGRAQLSYQATGGPSGGPFVRYTDDGTLGNDTNHMDGIGIIHLGLYFYTGHLNPPDTARFYLGGGFPDFRGAQFSMWLRGQSWDPKGATIGTWVQAFREPEYVDLAETPDPGRAPLRYPNWAYEGDTTRTAAAASSTWTECTWSLDSRTDHWTFGGCNGGRLLYDYGEIDSLLAKLTVDCFPIQILRTQLFDPPSGALDYADLRITYRQHSLLVTANGGSLVSSPAGGTGAEYLTDGYRNGAGREWQSAAMPSSPQDFVFAFADPVTLDSVTVHNATVDPSEGFEVAVSEDGGGNWTTLYAGTLPTSSARGPNDLFHIVNAFGLNGAGDAVWEPIHPNPVDRLRVRVTSGTNATRWALGEIEAHGTGATKLTDDAWMYVSRDVLVAAGAWHYRVVVTTDEGTTYGPDQTVTVT